jgi:hypothetical protein
MKIDGFTISEMSQTLDIRASTIKAALRRMGINPIAYIGQIGIYSKTALKTVRERNTRRGRPSMEVNSASS